jgi:hypothetical protein
MPFSDIRTSLVDRRHLPMFDVGETPDACLHLAVASAGQEITTIAIRQSRRASPEIDASGMDDARPITEHRHLPLHRH